MSHGAWAFFMEYIMIKSYEEAKEACKDVLGTMLLEPETLLIQDQKTFLITYCNMPLVRYTPDGSIIIYEDEDCATAIFRNRLNKYTPDCIEVCQKDFKLFVRFYDVKIEFDYSFSCHPGKKEVRYAEKVRL
jgi:hypothetical protein